MSHEDEYLSVEELIEIQKEETRDIIAALLEDGSDPDSLYIEEEVFLYSVKGHKHALSV